MRGAISHCGGTGEKGGGGKGGGRLVIMRGTGEKGGGKRGGEGGFEYSEIGEERKVGLGEKGCMITYKRKGVTLQHVVACRHFLPKVQKTPGVSLSAGRYFIQTDFLTKNFYHRSFAWMPEMQQQAMDF